MNNKKQIEEMAKEIDLNSHFIGKLSEQIAPFEIKNNYRKIEDHEIVISKDKHEILNVAINLRNIRKKMAEQYQARIDELEEKLDMLVKEQKEDRSYEIEQARKETARKFARRIKERIHLCENISQSTDDCLCEDIDEIAKQFGVEKE